MPAKKKAPAEPAQPSDPTVTTAPPDDTSAQAAPIGGEQPSVPAAENAAPGQQAEPEREETVTSGGVRRTRRTITRHVVDETVEETIVEDLPAAYSPPMSDYPMTVG